MDVLRLKYSTGVLSTYRELNYEKSEYSLTFNKIIYLIAD